MAWNWAAYDSKKMDLLDKTMPNPSAFGVKVGNSFTVVYLACASVYLGK
jgi:hypothetical protein